MKISELTEEKKAALLKCENADELRSCCEQENIPLNGELSDEVLAGVSGGLDIPITCVDVSNDPPTYFCPPVQTWE